MSQQPALDSQRIIVRAMHETTQPGLAYDAMTRDDDGYRIVATSLTDRLCAGTDLCRQLAIAHRFTARNFQHRLPDIALVMRTIKLEGQVDLVFGIGQISFQFSADRFRH